MFIFEVAWQNISVNLYNYVLFYCTIIHTTLPCHPKNKLLSLEKNEQ